VRPRGQVQGAKFPVLCWVVNSILEALFLLFVADFQPVLEQSDGFFADFQRVSVSFKPLRYVRSSTSYDASNEKETTYTQ
jgi:hypothetical protein